jgi:hypothetical protein
LIALYRFVRREVKGVFEVAGRVSNRWNAGSRVLLRNWRGGCFEGGSLDRAAKLRVGFDTLTDCMLSSVGPAEEAGAPKADAVGRDAPELKSKSDDTP